MGIITESVLFIVTPYLSRVSNRIPYVVGQNGIKHKQNS